MYVWQRTQALGSLNLKRLSGKGLAGRDGGGGCEEGFHPDLEFGITRGSTLLVWRIYGGVDRIIGERERFWGKGEEESGVGVVAGIGGGDVYIYMCELGGVMLVDK